MAFSTPVPRSAVGQSGGGEVRVASTTVAMGWVSATAVCQHIHRNLLRPPLTGSAMLPAHREWRKDRPHPLTSSEADTMSWAVYIDNLELLEVLPAAEATALRGTVSRELQLARDTYEHHGSPGCVEKDVERSLVATTLGVTMDGQLGECRPPSEYIVRLIGLTLWLLSRERSPVQHWQVVLGRWARVAGHRRPLFCCFDKV